MSTRLRRAIAFASTWLCLSTAAWCQPAQDLVNVEFAVYPPWAQVWDSQQALGPSGRPIPINLSKYGRDLIVLTLKAPGYHSQELRLRSQELRGGHYPAQTGRVVVLEPDDWWVSLSSHARAFPVQTVLASLSLAALAVAGLFWQRSSRRRWLQELERRQIHELNEKLRAEAGPNDPWQGQVVAGRYRLTGRIGAGGMATVYRGIPKEDHALTPSEEVAVKILEEKKWQGNDADALDFRMRFGRECRAGLLHHPNIVHLIDSGVLSQDRTAYLVFEFLRGQTLRELLPAEGFPVARALEYLQGIADALTYAHRLEVIHRDLKPENVMVVRQGAEDLIKVMDFGLARGSTIESALTMGTRLMGTPAYMAPEQLEGRSGPLTDQYSFGIVAFELFTGQLPFQASDVYRLLLMRIETPPPSMLEYRPDLPPALDEVVRRILDCDPHARYADLQEAMGALKSAAAS